RTTTGKPEKESLVWTLVAPRAKATRLSKRNPKTHFPSKTSSTRLTKSLQSPRAGSSTRVPGKPFCTARLKWATRTSWHMHWTCSKSRPPSRTTPESHPYTKQPSGGTDSLWTSSCATGKTPTPTSR
ncbi:Putative LOC100877383, partial [Caligus rogercresseyi]